MSNYHKYTEQEKQFCRENLKLFNCYEDFSKAFNEHFGLEISREKLKDLCTKRLKIGIGKSKTCFQKGHKKRSLPIGTISKTSYGTYIKVADTLTHFSGYKEPDWLPLQKKIYQDAFGTIPKGKMVIFLDCDKTNFSLDNLYCIDRKISAQLAKNRWYSKDKDVTLTAIKLCELQQALKIRTAKEVIKWTTQEKH